jgi:hypothetical protein
MAKQVECAEGFLPNVVSVGELSRPELLRVLGDSGIHLNQAAKDLFTDERFQPRRQAVDVKIEARSVSSLGFNGGATYGQIAARAFELGFAECSLELATYLRLQFLNQAEAPESPPSSEPGSPPGAITVASKPLDQSDEVPKGFYLRNIDRALWLRGYRSDASHVWSDADVFVFSSVER